MKFTKEMVMRIIKEEIAKHTNESNHDWREQGVSITDPRHPEHNPAQWTKTLDDNPPEAEGWLQQAEMVMEEIVEEGHGTSVADDVDYAIYKVGEMDPAAEQWLTQNKARVLELHPSR